MRKALFFVIGITLFVPAVGTAQRPHKSKNAVVIFQPDDRQVITEYFRNTRNLPPGLAKRGGNLPPGLEKQLRRNGQLPPGLEKRLTAFPYDLNRRLPPLPTIYHRGTIGDRAVIYDTKTNTILDMINIFAGR